MSNSFMTLWTIAPQAPLSMGFPRQGYWSGLPFLPPGDLPSPGAEPASAALAGGFFFFFFLPLTLQGSPYSLNRVYSWQTKLVGVMEFQLSYFILKDDAVKVPHSICQQISKTQQGPQDWKRSVFIPIPKKGNAKECSN